MTWAANSRATYTFPVAFTASSVTFEMLIYVTNFTGGPSILTLTGGSGTNNIFVTGNTSTGSLGIGSGTTRSTTSVLNVNTWYHLVVSYTNSTTINMYINGTFVSSSGGSVSNPNPYTSYIFGNYLSGNNFGIPGRIAMGRLYHRALNATEITLNYNSVKLNGNPYGLP